MTEREPGFYWVKDHSHDEWEPAQFITGCWFLTGWAVPCFPYEIGPRIEKPEELT